MVSVCSCEPAQLAMAQVPACPAGIVPFMEKVCSNPVPVLLAATVNEYCKPLTTPLVASSAIVYGSKLVQVVANVVLAAWAMPNAV